MIYRYKISQRRVFISLLGIAAVILFSGSVGFAQGAPDYWDPRLDDLGVTWEAPTLSPGQQYWKLVSGEYLNEEESAGLHHMFYKCLDSNGNQLANVVVVQEWSSGSTWTYTKAYPDWADIAMWGGNWCPPTPPGPYDGLVGDGKPTYRMIGCGLPCNHHVCYRMVFKLLTAVGGATPTNTPVGPANTPTPTPGTPPSPPVVANPSFESSLSGTWSMWIGSGGNGDGLERDYLGGTAPDGVWCLAVKGIGSGGKGAYQYVADNWVVGRNYRLSVYAKNLINQNMTYSIGYVLGQGGSGDGPNATYGTAVSKPSSWTQATVEFTYSGSGGVTIYLRAVNIGSSERAGFDLVEITDLGGGPPAPTDTPTNTPVGPANTPTPTPGTPPSPPVIANPSFESSLSGTWTMWKGSGGNGDGLERDWYPSGLPSGVWCLAVKGIGSGGKGAFQYVADNWVAGRNYRLSVYAKNLINQNMSYSIGYVLGEGDASDGPNANYGSVVSKPSSWTQATVEFTYSGSGGVTIYLRAVNIGSFERAGFDLVEVTDLGQ